MGKGSEETFYQRCADGKCVNCSPTGEATAAHHHTSVQYQEKTAGQPGAVIPMRMFDLATPLLGRFLGDTESHVHAKSYPGVRMSPVTVCPGIGQWMTNRVHLHREGCAAACTLQVKVH